MTEEETSLYRAYNSDGVLLYVGIARNWGRRWAQHSERSPFFAATARLDVERFPTRDAALAAERKAIKSEGPIHNVTHARTAPPKKERRLSWDVIVALEPRILPIAWEAEDAAWPDLDWFCANRVWYSPPPAGSGMKKRLADLVGWERHRDRAPSPVIGGRTPDGEWRVHSVAELLALHDPLDGYQAKARAAGDPEALYSTEAHRIVTNRIYQSLPDCRDCGCTR